jgi:hypothetical protein
MALYDFAPQHGFIAKNPFDGWRVREVGAHD